AHKACADDRYARLYLAVLLLCGYNLFFIVEGRTGQLIFVALILLFAVQRLTRKGLLFSVVAIIIFLALFLSFSEKATRLREGFANTQAYLQPQPEQTESSMGQRYTFWRYSLKLIAEKPLLGHGTGSFAPEYQRVAKGERFITKHPHNEFFMIGVQLGLLGLCVYLGFLASQYYCSRNLPKEDKWLAQGILLSLIITSLFNTPILDHTEGHWFASMIALCFANNFQVNGKVS
ncbi:MAG: O-antigen ligase family protein, partial [Methylobacter sp.]